eukprot:5789080-Amphidinium_carterae.1
MVSVVMVFIRPAIGMVHFNEIWVLRTAILAGKVTWKPEKWTGVSQEAVQFVKACTVAEPNSFQGKRSRFDTKFRKMLVAGASVVTSVKALLTVDPDKRLSASEALVHPWIAKSGDKGKVELALSPPPSLDSKLHQQRQDADRSWIIAHIVQNVFGPRIMFAMVVGWHLVLSFTKSLLKCVG